MWSLINGRWVAQVGSFTLSVQSDTWVVDTNGHFIAWGHDRGVEVGKRKAVAAMRDVIAELTDATDKLELEAVNA